MEPPATPIIAKKLSNMVRLILFTLQKGVSKKKLMMMKEHGKIIGKSFNDFMVRHHTALSCKSHDVHVSFVYPLEYEFSCKSSIPPYRSSYTPPCHDSGHNKGRYVRQRSRRSVYVPMMCENVLATVNTGRKVSFRGGDVVEPLPRVRRVRITEWEPLFPLNIEEEEEEEDYHVDKAAQEFIDKFYRELMLQKWRAVDSSHWS